MTWSDSGFARVARFVTKRAGIAFPETFELFAESGIRRAMAEIHIRDFDRYVAALQTRPRAMRALLDELSVRETFFFRHPEQFDIIREDVQAKLLANERNLPIRMWSAGCSSGEEVYSLAMLAEEMGILDRVHLMATDISKTAIEKARNGAYSGWSFRGEVEPWRARYFRGKAGRFELEPSIRAVVEFDERNLIAEHGSRYREMDVILCRNVLMYLEPAAVAAATSTLVSALTANGLLITSPSDPILVADDALETVVTVAGIVYRRRACDPSVALPHDVPSLAISSEHTVLPETAAVTPNRAASGSSEAKRIQKIIGRGCFDVALAESTAAAERFPLEPELHVLRALLALEVGDLEAALESARRAIYLDRTLAVAHYALGRASRLLGRHAPAQRALRRAQRLAHDTTAEQSPLLFDGITVSDLTAGANAEELLISHTGTT